MQQALDISPKNPAIISQHASLLAASGRLEDAYNEFLRAADMAPNDPAYIRQMIAFSLSHNYQVDLVALPLARQLLIQDPDSAVDQDWMAQVLIKLGDLDSAERFLIRCLQSDQGYAPAHLHLGLVYL